MYFCKIMCWVYMKCISKTNINFHKTYLVWLVKHIFLAFFPSHIWKGTRKLCVDKKKKIQVTAKLLVHTQPGNMTCIIMLFFMTSGRMQCPPFLQNSTSPKYLDKVWFPKLGKAPDLGITFKAVTTHPSLIDVKASLIQVLNSIPPYLLLHPHGWCIHMAKCYLVIMCSNLIANQELFL